MKRNLIAVLICATALAAGTAAAQAGDFIDEWASVKAPPPPALKPVTVDPKTTALLMLDFHPPNCTNRPRCMASLPAMKALLDAARARGMAVVYSTSGKAKPADIMKELTPAAGDLAVHSSVDKFHDPALDKFLKDKGIHSVIVNGTAAHGAVLYTGSESALRGLNVIVPVDGMSSEDLFYEQATVWLLAKGTGGIGPKVTLTTLDMIKF
jgi:nicotinamidase-related amidase